MSETVKQLYNGNIPESLYNDTKNKLEYLEGLVGELSVDKIDHLNKELETVKTERDSYSGQVKQLELRIQDLKKAHEDGKARQRGKWEADVDYYKNELNKSKTELSKCRTELNNCKAELNSSEEQLSECRTELEKELIKVDLLNTMDNKLDTVLAEITSISDMLVEMSENNSTKDDVIEAVKNRVNSINKVDVISECERIYIMTEQGLSAEQIAEIMYPGVKRGSIKVSERRKHKYYENIVGVTKDDAGVITGVIRE